MVIAPPRTARRSRRSRHLASSHAPPAPAQSLPGRICHGAAVRMEGRRAGRPRRGTRLHHGFGQPRIRVCPPLRVQPRAAPWTASHGRLSGARPRRVSCAAHRSRLRGGGRGVRFHRGRSRRLRLPVRAGAIALAAEAPYAESSASRLSTTPNQSRSSGSKPPKLFQWL